ncbi:MAG: hypothetical protein U0892_01770 [Pirellulales bacterium]
MVGTRLPQDVERRKQLLSGPMRLAFLNFRAEELNAFYTKIGESIRRSHPDAKLIIEESGQVVDHAA